MSTLPFDGGLGGSMNPLDWLRAQQSGASMPQGKTDWASILSLLGGGLRDLGGYDGGGHLDAVVASQEKLRQQAKQRAAAAALFGAATPPGPGGQPPAAGAPGAAGGGQIQPPNTNQLAWAVANGVDPSLINSWLSIQKDQAKAAQEASAQRALAPGDWSPSNLPPVTGNQMRTPDPGAQQQFANAPTGGTGTQGMIDNLPADVQAAIRAQAAAGEPVQALKAAGEALTPQYDSTTQSGINPATGKPERFALDKRTGLPRFLGIAPVPPQQSGGGINDLVTLGPDGKPIINNLVVQARAQAAGAEATARQKAGESAGASTPAHDAVVQSYVSNILGGNAMLQQVPKEYRNDVSLGLQSAPKTSYAPIAASRFANAANRIVSNFTKLPQYDLTSKALPMLQRIDVAIKNPGSVSDQELLDSFTKMSTGGNAVTEQQIRTITEGKSLSDWASVQLNRLNNGGIISDNQRKDIYKIAHSVFDGYKKGYQPVYDQATRQLRDSGIPESFWTIPNLSKLSEEGGMGSLMQQSQSPTKIPYANPTSNLHPLVNKWLNQ